MGYNHGYALKKHKEMWKKSFKFFEKALQGFIQIEPKAKKIKPYLQYQIGMMYFEGIDTPINIQKALEYICPFRYSLNL